MGLIEVLFTHWAFSNDPIVIVKNEDDLNFVIGKLEKESQKNELCRSNKFRQIRIFDSGKGSERSSNVKWMKKWAVVFKIFKIHIKSGNTIEEEIKMLQLIRTRIAYLKTDLWDRQVTRNSKTKSKDL